MKRKGKAKTLNNSNIYLGTKVNSEKYFFHTYSVVNLDLCDMSSAQTKVGKATGTFFCNILL